MNKNKKLLDSFIKYCEENPSQRFWQALCNWSQNSFILTSKDSIFEMEQNDDYSSLEDTYNWENINNK